MLSQSAAYSALLDTIFNPAPPPAYCLDIFVGSSGTPLESHTPDIGGPWTRWSGNMVLTGSQTVRQDSVTYDNAIYTVPLPSSDFDALGGWQPASDPFGNVGFALRVADANNMIYALAWPAAAILALWKLEAGVQTQLASVPWSFPGQALFQMTLQQRGNAITLTQGLDVLSFTTSFNSGVNNIGSWTNVNFSFFNTPFEVQPP